MESVNEPWGDLINRASCHYNVEKDGVEAARQNTNGQGEGDDSSCGNGIQRLALRDSI